MQGAIGRSRRSYWLGTLVLVALGGVIWHWARVPGDDGHDTAGPEVVETLPVPAGGVRDGADVARPRAAPPVGDAMPETDDEEDWDYLLSEPTYEIEEFPRDSYQIFAAQVEELIATVRSNELRDHALRMLQSDVPSIVALGATLLATLHEFDQEQADVLVRDHPVAALTVSGWLADNALASVREHIWSAFDDQVSFGDLSEWLWQADVGSREAREVLAYVLRRDFGEEAVLLYRDVVESDRVPHGARLKAAQALARLAPAAEMRAYFAEQAARGAPDDPFGKAARRLAEQYDRPEELQPGAPYFSVDHIDLTLADEYRGQWEDLALQVELAVAFPDTRIESGVVERLLLYVDALGDYPPEQPDGLAIRRIMNHMGDLLDRGGGTEATDTDQEEFLE